MRLIASPSLITPSLMTFPSWRLAEALELGTYTDFDRLFDVLGLVSEQALDWEAQLVSFDDEDYEEPDVYDIFGEDDEDEDEDYLDGDDADLDDESDAPEADEK